MLVVVAPQCLPVGHDGLAGLRAVDRHGAVPERWSFSLFCQSVAEVKDSKLIDGAPSHIQRFLQTVIQASHGIEGIHFHLEVMAGEDANHQRVLKYAAPIDHGVHGRDFHGIEGVL